MESKRKVVILYPCLNGDKIVYKGTPVKGYDGEEFINTQYYLVIGKEALTLSKDEAMVIMDEESFFEVLPGNCPTTASGFIDTKLDPATVITGF